MKKSRVVLVSLAFVAVLLAFLLLGRTPSTSPSAPPRESRARIAPGDLPDDLLDQVAVEPGPALNAAQPGIAAPSVPSPAQEHPGHQPAPGLLARFELILGAMPVDEHPTDVSWTCSEVPDACQVEGTLASSEHIADLMRGLEDSPQAVDDEIPTVYLNQMNSLPEGGIRFQLQIELP
jgi:hypothetical protein